MGDLTGAGFEDLDAVDPAALSVADLRALRSRLQTEDDVVSYVRRIAQARCDLLAARYLEENPQGDVTGELGRVLSQHLTGGPPRPPRSVEPVDDHPLLARLEEVCAAHGFARAEELTPAEIHRLVEAISAFEQEVSRDRRARYEVLDALSAELVRRYRSGEAQVDSLLE